MEYRDYLMSLIDSRTSRNPSRMMDDDVRELVGISREVDLDSRMDESVPKEDTEVTDVDELAMESSSLAGQQEPATDPAIFNLLQEDKTLEAPDPKADLGHEDVLVDQASVTKLPEDDKSIPDAKTERVLDVVADNQGTDPAAFNSFKKDDISETSVPEIKPDREDSSVERAIDPAAFTSRNTDGALDPATFTSLRASDTSNISAPKTEPMYKGNQVEQASATKPLIDRNPTLDAKPEPLIRSGFDDSTSQTFIEVPKELEQGFNEIVESIEQDLLLKINNVAVYDQNITKDFGLDPSSLLPDIPESFYVEGVSDMYPDSEAQMERERRS